MEKFLATVSRGVLASILIGAGILFIIFNDPPRTVCHAQNEVFVKNETGFLFKDPKDKVRRTSRFKEFLDRCKMTNSPGGCYELFIRLRQTIASLRAVSGECLGHVGDQRPVKDAIWGTLDLMVKIAWGSKPPDSYYEKFAWLDTSDVALYCQLKGLAGDIYGSPQWESFRERQLKELPGAAQISRKDAWDKSILSSSCDRYQ